MMRMRCLAFLPACLGLIAAVSGGCEESSPHLTPYTILFDKQGKERTDPEGDLWRMLVSEDLSDAERRRLVDEAVAVIEEGEGYSRYIAADALLYLTKADYSEGLPRVIKVDGPSLVTQRMVDAFAHHCLRVSRNSLAPSVEKWLGTDYLDQVPVGWIIEGLNTWQVYENAPSELRPFVRVPDNRWDYPVDAALVVEVGSRMLPLGRSTSDDVLGCSTRLLR